jgi:hypothetical protein
MTANYWGEYLDLWDRKKKGRQIKLHNEECDLMDFMLNTISIINPLNTEIIITGLINALPGNISLNTAQQAAIEEAVFSVNPTDAAIDWLDSDHVIYVYCRSMFVPRLYK